MPERSWSIASIRHEEAVMRWKAIPFEELHPNGGRWNDYPEEVDADTEEDALRLFAEYYGINPRHISHCIKVEQAE
jgi:hypothetical protein